MEREYVVTFPMSRQISEDRWEVYNPSLKVTDETTVREIRKWVAQQHRAKELDYPIQVQLIELEKSNG